MDLAEELLKDIEEQRIEPRQIVFRARRLALLLGDASADYWLRHEASGYRSHDYFEAKDAASAVGRLDHPDDETAPFKLASLTRLKRYAEDAYRGGDSVTGLRATDLIETVVNTIHAWVVDKYLELRFGGAAESAFELLREQVDRDISRLAPDAALMFSAAFENIDSDNPEHWANAASTCRRLLREIADQLQPSSEPINGRDMTADKYINRLAYWIEQREASSTRRDVVLSDLEFLGKRLDAFDDAGHKGAHATVTREEASRYLVGTYLLAGDILALDPGVVETLTEQVMRRTMRFLEMDREVTDEDIEELDAAFEDDDA
ncbi:hypothetical protein [Demequina zhanjiangensis]|uniref:AbiTii domain-containing protein n=1 Tax=Demequina zhanjiangensis TaxID=3051659 RepID=A0ABT8G4T5_9MICO|nr:hypothetical protein [Demequina sp. SYSU T00b26]MDN4473719.1 hypothetical protein [Demequina sp. SYSU T00b26]